MNASRPSRRLIPGIVLSIGFIGWLAIQPGRGAAPDEGVENVAPTEETPPPHCEPTATIALKKRGTAVEAAQLPKLNYEDSKSPFTVDIAGFSDANPNKGGEIQLLSDGTLLSTVKVAAGEKVEDKSKSIPVNLEALYDQGVRKLQAIWVPQGAVSQTSHELALKIDTRGPTLDSLNVTGDPAVGLTLVLTFADDDLDPDSARNPVNYEIRPLQQDGQPGEKLALSAGSIATSGNVVRIALGRLPTGGYQLTVKGAAGEGGDGKTTPLRDASGNLAGGRGNQGSDQSRPFSSFPAPEQGPRIEFPEFLPTAPQPVPERRANPGDRVETRVVRLYYFRDAHRVAQLINRTAQAYNRAAVTQAQRRAEDARVEAEKATDERRHDEREAVRAAEQLRQVEHQLVAARQQAAQATQQAQKLQERHNEATSLVDHLNDQITAKQAEITQTEKQIATLKAATANKPAAAPPAAPEEDPMAQRSGQRFMHAALKKLSFRTAAANAADDPAAADGTQQKLKELNDQLANQKGELAGLQSQRDAAKLKADTLAKNLADLDPSGAQAAVERLQVQAATLSELAAQSNEDSLQAQAKEDRAVEEQFRQQIAAAHADPDTYAPAKKDSIDPVAQVSVSVIGEGVLQLRGPSKGIDQIRKMIDEIDSPVGQIKVDIVTVQVNGEKGNKMERSVGKIAANLGLGRFLTAQSLMYLRRAVQMEAAQIAVETEQGGHYQLDRDRKYLYSFFGRDFVDELYEMDSEFLRSENKLLSLHSMDTVSLHRALFMLALAKNDVRERILARFMVMVESELPQAEFDYRRSSELAPHKTRQWLPHHDHERLDECTFEAVQRNALNRYHFTNLRGFFSTFGGACGEGLGDPSGPDTMNPMQREFIRLAQIYKVRMVAEAELKQRVIERSLIEDDRERSIEEEEVLATTMRTQVKDSAQELQKTRFQLSAQLAEADVDLAAGFAGVIRNTAAIQTLVAKLKGMSQMRVLQRLVSAPTPDERKAVEASIASVLDELEALLKPKAGESLPNWIPATSDAIRAYDQAVDSTSTAREKLKNASAALKENYESAAVDIISAWQHSGFDYMKLAEVVDGQRVAIERLKNEFLAAANPRRFDWDALLKAYSQLQTSLQSSPELAAAAPSLDRAFERAKSLHVANSKAQNAKSFLAETRTPLDKKKLLDYLLDEKQEKLIDIKEGTRSHVAVLDNYLKRLAIALEDDFMLQFYEPAFARVRRASRQWDVTLGQIERTSVLANNRAYAAVHPTATMEFDLPKRDILLVEAMNGAKALTQDMGALLNDPTFLAAFKMMGGGPPPTKVVNGLPGLPAQPDEQKMGVTSDAPERPLGASLEALIPDPSIYKFETGTGYEIRPVIQPDGDSIVYDFLYMYTTNVREPVRADEKHLGRVKRHFINTQVQTSSFELREVSRYQVALKAARTAQGVPLLQQIPVAGWLFRPLPSAESSIQENIVLAQSVVYPTVFDLMGLDWAPSIVDLDHVGVRDMEHVVRGRNETINNAIFDMTSERADEMLDLEHASPENFRPDLRRPHVQPSPHHPGGYTYPAKVEDPTGRGFQVPDRRPQEMREPPYDRRFRQPIRYEEAGTEEHYNYEVIGDDAQGPALPQPDSAGSEIKTPMTARDRASLPASPRSTADDESYASDEELPRGGGANPRLAPSTRNRGGQQWHSELKSSTERREDSVLPQRTNGQPGRSMPQTSRRKDPAAIQVSRFDRSASLHAARPGVAPRGASRWPVAEPHAPVVRR